MGVSNDFYALDTLLQEKELLVPFKLEAGSDPSPVWISWRRIRSLTPAEN
jgi:hypothetical protein